MPAEVTEPPEIANNGEVEVEETVPEPATELAPEVEGLPEMVDLPPTPKDWQTDGMP